MKFLKKISKLLILIWFCLIPSLSGSANLSGSEKLSILIYRYENSNYSEPLKTLLSMKSNNEEAISLYNLGIMNIERNLPMALDFFQKAGLKGLVEAQFNFARYISEDLNKKHKVKEIIKWYLLAAKQNYAPAQFNLGVFFGRVGEEADNVGLSLNWYRLAAKAGYAPAQSNLGVLFATGNGVERNLKKAINWLTLAAEQQHILSFYNLGVAYEEIARLEKSGLYQIYAVRWYKRAALKGHHKSMLNLGTMLASATGVHKDLKSAHMWVNISLSIKCSRDRMSCRWNKKMFKGPVDKAINHLWDLRIEIERQLKPAQIIEAHDLAKKLIAQNEYIKKLIN